MFSYNQEIHIESITNFYCIDCTRHRSCADCIDRREPACFKFNMWGGKEMTIYNLKDNKVIPFCSGRIG